MIIKGKYFTVDTNKKIITILQLCNFREFWTDMMNQYLIHMEHEFPLVSHQFLQGKKNKNLDDINILRPGYLMINSNLVKDSEYGGLDKSVLKNERKEKLKNLTVNGRYINL